MKRFLYPTLLLCIVLLAPSCGAAFQERKAARAAEEAAEHAAIVNALQNNDFILEITQIIPRGFPSKISTGEYTLRMKGDVVTTRLPYIGVSHEATYGGVDDISIIFDKEKVQVLKDVSKASKGEYYYQFRGGKGKDVWTVTLQIYDNGSASIGCSASGGRYMSYFANLVIPNQDAEN